VQKVLTAVSRKSVGRGPRVSGNQPKVIDGDSLQAAAKLFPNAASWARRPPNSGPRPDCGNRPFFMVPDEEAILERLSLRLGTLP